MYRQAETFNCGFMTTVAQDGKQRDALCIPLKKLNGWLFSINPQKVRPEIKETWSGIRMNASWLCTTIGTLGTL
ncbi:hypothetical protein DSLASN_01610 [Desulfoluna limicola]|uniref:Antirepressor protein ant N-terminal domain-containing protein n=1 Tax=Desulfoluna limicola TaxID=2810562 RepID=A0ABM7PBF0_9BACT|nr:phage antirepressor N-terminal domain-containing protein [Desulfoluna limicola]BCS94529.1 hypothetical protein DSLASN_01610 [Desulfoluna limicola]